MAASLDGFVARKDGRVDWLQTSDEFAAGTTLQPSAIESFLAGIGCYVMGSRTYELALEFESKGHGWAYGEKPTFVLTRRQLPRIKPSVELCNGDLAQLINTRLRPTYRTIWIVGGPALITECLRLGLADSVRYTVLPVMIGDGIPFFTKFDKDIALHLAGVNAYRDGSVELHYQVRNQALNAVG
jgi:dihydrofolate reductase